MATQIHPEVRAMYEQVQGLLQELRTAQGKKQKLVETRHQLGSQQTENELVREELLHLEDGAGVYKLIGPVLVSQDSADARMIVEKRLEFIRGEIKRTESSVEGVESQEETLRVTIMDLQRRMQETQMKMMQQQQQQQQK